MIDKEIIKALECCLDAECNICPYEIKGCNVKMCGDALYLIKRQQLEIDRLQKANENFNKEFNSYYVMIKSQAIKEFSDVLKSEIRDKKYSCVTDTNYSKTVNSVLSSCISTIYRCANEFIFNLKFNNLK